MANRTARQGADQMFHQSFMYRPMPRYLVDKTINTDSTVVVEYDVVSA
jgi:hypothetical protein